MPSKDPERPERGCEEGLINKVTESVLGFIGNIPASSQELSSEPKAAARKIANSAAIKAATTAGALALPPGPLGWSTILPEIVAVWKIQGQMVADIASVFGKTGQLSQEQMIYCLFRHTAAQAVRDLVVRVGERYLVRRASLRTMQNVAQKVGIKVTQKALGKGISRWVPVVSALGVGGYAWYDTANVAKTAIRMFESEVILEE
jgi:hypothetical protein